ncbi:MAG: tetratricopeptide repeat protein [Candidatus Firestonebacteria bacterium]|nr:tetratricopeptide repeat protein [Candidatus Firestonebacteria bacterium]
MKNKRGTYERIVFILFILSIFIVLSNNNVFAQAFKRFQEGDKIKPILLKTLEGKEINTEDFINSNILGVLFWKLPSPRGVSALKYLQKIQDNYKNQNILILSIYCPRDPKGISSDELEEIKKVLEENNITLSVLLDDGLKTFNTYGVISLPSTMILDKEGIARYILAGFPKFGAEQEINKNVKKILGIPEEAVALKKYEPKLPASRNYKLAVSVLERGNDDKAINYLKEAITFDPDYADPYALLGKLYIKAQKNDEALENLRKSLELDSLNIDVMMNYGFLCLELEMKDDALLVFKKIVEKTPEYAARGHYGIGTIYLKNKIFDSALNESERAFDLYNTKKIMNTYDKLNFAQNISNMAEIYINLNDKSKAINAYKKAGEKYNEILIELSK